MERKKVLGPVIMRRNLQELPSVRGRFLLDFRPEYHLGEQNFGGGEQLYPPAVTHTAFRAKWESQGRQIFEEDLDTADLGTSAPGNSSGTVLFPSRALTLKIVGDTAIESDLLDEVTELFAERLHGMFAALAYRAAALGEKRVLICNHGRFEPNTQGEILRRIPFDVYRAREILNDLYRELIMLLRYNEICGTWGRVWEDNGEVCIELNPTLPEFAKEGSDEEGAEAFSM